MKNLFLFALSAIMICGCSKNGNETPAPPEEDIFSVDETMLEFSGRGGTQYISFESTQDWTLSGGASWCEPSQKSGSGTDRYFSVDFSATSNTTTDNRSTAFTLKSGKQSVEIQITQGFVPTVNVSAAGTLQQILTEQNLLETTELKINGIPDETDFQFLKSVLTLDYLDISDVNLEELPEKAFANSLISHVILPRSLKVIGNEMFDMAKTRTVQMFDEVVAIDDRAFYMSEIHSDFHFSSKLQTIGKEAFYHCSGLYSLKFPASLETIGESAFANLIPYTGSFPSLDYIFFEKESKLKTIETGAFKYAIDHGGIIYMQHCTEITDMASDAFRGDIASKFYLGVKTPPASSLPFDRGSTNDGGRYTNGWTVEIYVPAMYVDAYGKIWGSRDEIIGRYMSLEDNMPEDK